MKTWNLDRNQQVHVRRYGFPIVPDFGGTAHAYCGDTLKTVIGDLMKWSYIPNLDNALRAYIIKSRVRHIDDLLLAQPYSPMFFSSRCTARTASPLAGTARLIDTEGSES